MTVSSKAFTSTEALTCSEKTKFYPLQIAVHHPQLRHLISTVEQDWIYLATSNELYAIHLPSRRKSLLVTLPFSPRCLVAGLGWICVGGEHNGKTAFIRLDKDKIYTRSQVEEPSVGEPSLDLGRDPGNSERQHEMLLNELGGSIVNSITLHDLSNTGRFERNEPVALLSNNDKTVKIYSLLQQQVIANLHHPFPINYALISPDSETLVVVGDSSQAYFYRRKWVPCKKSRSRLPKYQWEVLSTPDLIRGDSLSEDHSFSITFSPSGHLCAISAQGGVISVFDMESINSLGADDPTSYQSALVCSFKSSRSGDDGFVRSMAFSPAPWDLLAWGEDHGRAGIADIRQAFSRRQVLDLDTEAANVEHIKLDDVTDTSSKPLNSQHRHNTQSGNVASVSDSLLGGPEDWQLAAGRESQAAHRFGLGDLDSREQSVLDTLEVTMEDVDDAMNGGLSQFPGPYGVSPQPRRSLESEERSPSRAHLESLIDVFRERNLLRPHGNERQNQPRRRSSVVGSRNEGSGTPGTFRLMPGSHSRSRITASPVRMADDDVDAESLRVFPHLPRNDASQALESLGGNTMPHDMPPADLWNTFHPSFESPSQDEVAPAASRPTLANAEQDISADGGVATRPSLGGFPSTDEAFARTSSLPTTHNSAQSQASFRLQSSQPTSHRVLPLSELETERQVRRPVLPAAGLEARDGRSRPRIQGEDDRVMRIPEARIQARQRFLAREHERLLVREHGRLFIREHEQSSSSIPSLIRSSASQRSELIGRASPADLRLTRQMMMQSARNAVDGNGNWIAGQALERLLDRSGSRNLGSVESAFVRERGVGTSGLGWSENGRQLYVGTEHGIFGYTINLRDRIFFPSFEVR